MDEDTLEKIKNLLQEITKDNNWLYFSEYGKYGEEKYQCWNNDFFDIIDEAKEIKEKLNGRHD